MKKLITLSLIAVLFSCNGSAQKNNETKESFEVTKTTEQWKKELTEKQYYVLR
ncbi:MAG: peptide-methionine (R)-S-oxide reductase, partial [Winogradskyella sp.]|nr:peptide-methionine (R)-S-oxide reductase [Winogradskyella sp.]